MGIFDKLLGSKDIKLTPKGAMALAALTVIAIDGSIDDDELAGLARIVRNDRNAIDQAVKVFKDRKPLNEIIDLVTNALNKKQRLTTIVNLIDLAMADGILAGSEKDLLQSYVKSFQISDQVLEGIVDVIGKKNDFSAFA